MPAFPTADPAVLDRLRRFDTPTVCNVLELFAARPRTAGYMDARITACFPKMPPMVPKIGPKALGSDWAQGL